MKHDPRIFQILCYPSALHSESMPAVERKQLNPENTRKNNIKRGRKLWETRGNCIMMS